MPTGARIRANNLFGTTTDSPLSAAATSFSSAALFLFPVVASAHAVVVLDPKRVNGEPEIVFITAHTALSNSATITRGAYGTTARIHPPGTAWAHVEVTDDMTPIVTSATRPTDPFEGQRIYEIDTHRPAHRDNTQWLPGGPVSIVTAASRPANPYEGQMIYETDTDRVLKWSGTQWTQYRMAFEPDQFFGITLSNGVATSLTAFYTNNALLSLPYDYRMIVQAHVNTGANSVANIVFLHIQDEGGINLMPKGIIDASWRYDNSGANRAAVWSLISYKDYAAGATCGFRMAYKVDTSNIYLDGIVRVSFQPR